VQTAAGKLDNVKADVWGLASSIANHIGADWQPRRSQASS